VLHGREHERPDAEADQHQGKVARTENAMCHVGLALTQVLERLVGSTKQRVQRSPEPFGIA